MLEDEDDRDFSPVGNMVPRFDRSYKPKLAPPSHTPSSIASSGSRQLVSSQQEAEWERNLARLRGFQGIESSSRRCLTGLKNLGNTCYMNSILQVWVFLCSGTRTLQYAPNCLEHRKCIKMDLNCPQLPPHIRLYIHGRPQIQKSPYGYTQGPKFIVFQNARIKIIFEGVKKTYFKFNQITMRPAYNIEELFF